MESYVARTFDMDFVYLDLAFCAVWMLVLLRRRQTVALWFGLFGALVVFLVDDVLWLRVQHTRFLDVPLNRDLFLLYFSFTYGMIEFSYVTVMFGARSARTAVLWTLFLYGGWMATALISQNVGLDDRTIDIGRDMSDSRIVQAALVAGGYLLLVVLKYTWGPMKSLTLRRLACLFLVGVAVHFGMEITLLASGIRPARDWVEVLLFNSLLEFNMGIPILFILWTALQARRVSRAGGEGPLSCTPGA